jgi:hypothetical protein
VLAFLAILICLMLPSADLDRDGFTGSRERAHGCDAMSAASFPVCVDLDGDGVGETEPIAPLCSIAASGFAPCA